MLKILISGHSNSRACTVFIMPISGYFKTVLTLFLFFFAGEFCQAEQAPPKSISVYKQLPKDRDAVYFTPANFGITTDGKTDVSDALQQAIDKLKTRDNFGVVFIPEGKYLISKTIYIPTAIRIIGFGNKRPQIILRKNSPGFQMPDTTDKGLAKYMFWFTGGIPRNGRVPDANASTFYSAVSNLDIFIGDGNPQAVAFRAHFAQHSFISHVDIHTGKGKAGLFDVGNEIRNVRFFGGDYGIYTTKPSPGWQFVMLDAYFEGQRKAAVKTREAGLTILGMVVKNAPVAIDIDLNHYEKLIMENSRLENVKTLVSLGLKDNSLNQINMRQIACRNVPVISHDKHTGNTIKGNTPVYLIDNFREGLQMDAINADAVYKTVCEVTDRKEYSAIKKTIQQLPEMNTWVNLQDLGAKGDGKTDDTKAIRDAIDRFPNIYVPQGRYRITGTIKLKENTALIGLNPISTQFLLADNTTFFGGFGAPVAMIEAPKGGTNILSGIGLYTGIYNNRAVACKWMAGANSLIDDVKFIGGHGTMEKPEASSGGFRNSGNRDKRSEEEARTQPGIDEAWNTQYASIWITDGGGGTFNNIWSANTFANSGVYVSDTATPSNIYALSVEHHVLNEVVFDRVSNWNIYALQTEEENREGSFAQPLDLQNCSNLRFANLYMYRVTRVNLPYPAGVRTWNCQNIDFSNLHNFSQTKFVNTSSIYDVNSDTEIRPWEFAHAVINSNADQQKNAARDIQEPVQLAKGFEFANGITGDSKGNIYFCESRLRRIYKWSAGSNSLSILANIPWEPLALGVDQNDRLLVVFKYFEREGYPQLGTSTKGWGYVGFTPMVYSFDQEKQGYALELLQKHPIDSLSNIARILYPSNRGVGFYDYDRGKIRAAKDAYVAGDGKTVIPLVADLFRANGLQEARPGKILYATDEFNKRTVKFDVGSKGELFDLKGFTERGEFGAATDNQGNVYVADGNIFVYNGEGKQIREIKVPERPTTIFVSPDGKNLFYTSRSALYKLSIVD
ncbi:glycosyl hydrolase family 28-related protein [Pedobacter sp. UBA5917]|jgi:sugar lactone lactonase YvrE|uniref:glycosyl hydrolase family 28-related protein n=1 Tax=Pedobacter sp. UBA5917 TaxID=1947061 RepID=UPI0025DBD8B1|nr:glycosyl hydrolase family 28-related protein [Pedobacter sp. UBA5917]